MSSTLLSFYFEGWARVAVVECHASTCMLKCLVQVQGQLNSILQGFGVTCRVTCERLGIRDDMGAEVLALETDFQHHV